MTTVRNFGCAAALMLCIAPANATTLYECQLKAGVKSTPDGNIEQATATWINQFNPMTIDVVSGAVLVGESKIETSWKTVQRGGDAYDWVLRKDIEASGGADDSVIRVRDWKGQEWWKGGPSVIFYYSGMFHVGVCKALQ